MSYNMHVERIDGTIVPHDSNILKYPSQLDEWAKVQVGNATNPDVLVTVWQHDKGEVRKKFYSNACWEIETFALEMFEKLCKEHDWYYEYSDDHRVWSKGRDDYGRLQAKYQWMLTKCPEAANAIWEMHNPFLKNKEHV